MAAKVLLVALATIIIRGDAADLPAGSNLGRRALLQDPEKGRGSWNRNTNQQWKGNTFNDNGWGSNGGNGRGDWGSVNANSFGSGYNGHTGGYNDRKDSRPAVSGWTGHNGKAWRNNKGDKQSLEAIAGPFSSYNGYQGIRSQPITVSGRAGTLAQGIRRRGGARAAADSLAQAYSSGQADAAAQAVANAATASSTADASAAAEAVAETTINHPGVASQLLAKTAGLCVSRGQTDAYADTMADALRYARKKKKVPQFAEAVADAIATGGAPARYATGQAIATAIADGGEGQAAVAEATASVICNGDGSTARSWASAFAIALSQDSRGCLVLNQAKALAQAQCGTGAADAFTNTEATTTVLGFCGLLKPADFGSLGWSGGNTGSSSNGNAQGDASAIGSTAGNNSGGTQYDYNG